jgi:alcohol dehydrogenase class IV
VAQAERAASVAAFLDWLTALKAAVGIPAKLSAVGITEAQIEPLVAIAIADICHQTNPRPCSEDDFRALFRSAL